MRAFPAREFPLLPLPEQGAKETITTRSRQRSAGRRAAAATGRTRAGRSRMLRRGTLKARGGTVAPAEQAEAQRARSRRVVEPGISSAAHRIRAADPFTPKLRQHEAASLPRRPRSRYAGLKRRAADRRASPYPKVPSPAARAEHVLTAKRTAWSTPRHFTRSCRTSGARAGAAAGTAAASRRA
jgi:hypothetical protein